MKKSYTDPLAAAYMVKGFGVEIYQIHKRRKHEADYWDLILDSANSDLSEVYYIHPNSYHIFEPQKGDIVRVDMPEKVEVGEIVSNGLVQISDYQALHDPLYGDVIEIIQRNNKPFFWPESEK